ncbi:unnamed protein product [Rhizophagus irregularis]|nr:unnamed protein product [Rhizophagus irregularis]
MSGEANSAPLETLPEERLRLRTLLAKYNEEDIYNADETGLFFQMEPNQTLGTGSHFNPKVFEKTNSDLNESDEEVAESSHSAQNRKKAKKKVAKKKPDIKLTNIEIVYLPPNTTAHLQPMDAGILPSSDCIIDDVNMQGIELNELDELNEINLDLLPEADDLREYFHMLDHDIPTEEHLTDEQIINLLQDEGNESNSEGDISDDEEAMIVTEKKGVEALKTFINYFEQQNDPEFNIDELHIFRKYLRILKVREFNSKHQTTLDIFFKR